VNATALEVKVKDRDPSNTIHVTIFVGKSAYHTLQQKGATVFSASGNFQKPHVQVPSTQAII
jgi:hypothetical protein